MQASHKSGDRDQLLAHLLLFITPAMFATNMLMACATTDLIPPVAQAFWRWLGACLLLPFLAWESLALGPADFGDWRVSAAIATLVLVPGLGAYGTFSFITKHLGPSRTGLMLYTAPVYTAVMAWLLLGEAFLFYHWAGAALVLCSLFLATHKPAR